MKRLLSTLTLVLALVASQGAYAKNTSYDIQFIDTMTKHHEDGIKMMKIGLDKAKSQDIKNMAQKGIDDQKMDISEMKKMRGGINSDAEEMVNMDMPGMMPKEEMDKDMTKLKEASGRNFDEVYLETMIKHHKGAIKMSDDAFKKLSNKALDKKAHEMHDKQKMEISEMQKMRDAM